MGRKCVVLPTTLGKDKSFHSHFMRNHKLLLVDKTKYLDITINGKLSWSIFNKKSSQSAKSTRKHTFLRNLYHYLKASKQRVLVQIATTECQHSKCLSKLSPYKMPSIKMPPSCRLLAYLCRLQSFSAFISLLH